MIPTDENLQVAGVAPQNWGSVRQSLITQGRRYEAPGPDGEWRPVTAEQVHDVDWDRVREVA